MADLPARRREVAGAGRGSRAGRERAAGALLLTGKADRRRAGRRPQRAPWSCSRRHAWLPGRLRRRRRKGCCGPSADLCLGDHLFSPLPPWAPPPLLLSLHFFTPVPSRSWFSRLSPEPTSPLHSTEDSASHEPFVLGLLGVGCDLPIRGSSFPRRSPVHSPATCGTTYLDSRSEAGERAGERCRGPGGKRSCQGRAAPGSPGEPRDPGLGSAKRPPTMFPESG